MLGEKKNHDKSSCPGNGNSPGEYLTSQSPMVFTIGHSPEPVNSVGVFSRLSGQKEAEEIERGGKERERES
jgi:hypothetical protein